MYNFCTIITSDYIHYAQVLNDSLLEFSPNICLTVLIADRNSLSPVCDSILKTSIECIYLDQILNKYVSSFDFNDILVNYSNDELRWSLKPTLLKYLVLEKLQPIIYLDVDLYFVNSFDFLFDYFKNYNFLLSPHFRSIEPSNLNSSFEKVFTQGFFNAGFVGATHQSISILEWWETACLFKCKKDVHFGYYDDQRYLDIIPLQFEKVAITKHSGCNVASWNIDTCKRSYHKGSFLINNEVPIVFIHFSRDTCEQIIFGSDHILMPLLIQYADSIDHYNPSVSFISNIREVHEKKVKEYYNKLQKKSILKRGINIIFSIMKNTFSKN